MHILFSKKIRLLFLFLIASVFLLYYKKYQDKNQYNEVSRTADNYKKKIDLNQLPQHVAVMMDGNGRWAVKQGQPRIFGHKHALKSVEETIRCCADLNISYLTLYAFSIENWQRPADEVNALMQLFVTNLHAQLDELVKNNVKLRAIGDHSLLPTDCQEALQKALQATQHNTGLQLIIALSYSGRWDITQATRKIAQEVAKGKLKPEDIDNFLFQQHLATHDIPDPDLLIRTGGDYRISNFLLWQLAYTEILIVEKFWPDFRAADLYAAIIQYQKRERRFGKIVSNL